MEKELIQAHIDHYLESNRLELSEEQKESVNNSVQFWLKYTIEDVIEDAVNGVTFHVK
ncbi:hypothetical protein [Sporosarcina sp. FSL W7-1283]|uniref:hypothetical protein n=1 Tax=Sporosarcina sp. FSL W7-1283 TaxID=2921560 RepID=UPI0030FBF25F